MVVPVIQKKINQWELHEHTDGSFTSPRIILHYLNPPGMFNNITNIRFWNNEIFQVIKTLLNFRLNLSYQKNVPNNNEEGKGIFGIIIAGIDKLSKLAWNFNTLPTDHHHNHQNQNHEAFLKGETYCLYSKYEMTLTTTPLISPSFPTQSRKLGSHKVSGRSGGRKLCMNAAHRRGNPFRFFIWAFKKYSKRGWWDS